jgi:pimeloyl-ACP methyl ester carboxylesterase
MMARMLACMRKVRHPLGLLGLVPALLLALAGCDEGETEAGADAGGGADAALDGGPPPIPDGWPKAECDALDPTACALPWPSSLYLEPTDETVSGVRLTFGARSLPDNRRRRPLEPELFTGLDGYGLGSSILVGLGALDYGPLPGEWENLERSVEADSPTLLLKVTADGLERVPHFVEPDLGADPEAPLTYLRPAVILEPATRYVVAFRDLRTEDGAPVEASEAFAALRDGTPSADPGVEARRARFEEIFGWLEDAGVAREELVLAWDFVTGSEEALHQRLDRAIELALERAPDGGTITVDEVETFVPADDGSGTPVDPNIRYRLRGRMTRPMVVERPESGGWRMSLDADGRVALADDADTRVLIHVPHRALEGDPEGVIVYGHGLFGSEQEIRADHLRRLAQEHGFVLAAVPMVGMAGDDLEAVAAALNDLNGFGVISDGLHQGILDHHLLVRAARRTLADVLRDVDAAVAIDPEEVHYFGGSQGGIFGQTILATSPDLTRGVMAVPGNNYNTMLQRSVNFDDFETLLQTVYPEAVDRAIVLACIQLLWDRTDPVSYLGRMLQPARFDEPERRALLMLSKGDYQVAVVTNEIAARTWPDELRVMAGYDERIPWGLETTDYPHEGSGMILYDFGNPWPTDRGNRPPSDGLGDPHSRIAEIEDAGVQLETFLREGRIIDICGGDGCNPQ